MEKSVMQSENEKCLTTRKGKAKQKKTDKKWNKKLKKYI
jgi:hypothetical protein